MTDKPGFSAAQAAFDAYGMPAADWRRHSEKLSQALAAYHQHLADTGRLVEWQPIETAPKDGTKIWLYYEGTAYWGHWYQHRAVSGWITDVFDCAMYDFRPTRWMPLPAPPAEGER